MPIEVTDEMKFQALTVMKVTFWDGNKVTFYGLGHTRQGNQRLTREIQRHKRNVSNRIDRVFEAVIYKNRYPAKDGGKEDIIMRYEKGAWI